MTGGSVARNSVISVIQIAAALARVVGYSLAVLKIGAVAGSSGLLLAIGYLPFLAFADVLVQAYSRARHVHAGSVPTVILKLRRYVASALLLTVSLVFIFGLYRGTLGSASALLVGTYLAGGLAYFWERWTACNERQLWLSLLELSIISGSLLGFYLFGHQIVVLLLCLISFPLARLMLLSGPGEDPPVTELPDSPTGGVRGYVIFSLAQQVVGAVSSSLPSIVGQMRGDYSGLAANLVSFRLMHSIAATASLVINAMGARLFYAANSSGFDAFERYFVGKSNLFRASIIALLICALVIAFVSPSAIAAANAPLVLILIFINFVSSLSMNRGLPKSSLFCQIVVLSISAALISMLAHSLQYFSFFVILSIIVYLPVHSAVFAAHSRRLLLEPALRA